MTVREVAEAAKMEALSPRSTNIEVKPKQTKEKDFAAVEVPKVEERQKEKDLASPPPPWVLQPPLKPGLLAEKFQTGAFLGKGGFAICYEGELRGKKNGPGNCKFAMKIVKAKMPQTKISDKVSLDQILKGISVLSFKNSSAPSYRYTRRCDIPISSNFTGLSRSRRIPMSSLSFALTVQSWI